jgi:hypothetical protein
VQEFPPATLSFEAFARKPGIKGVIDVSNKFLMDYLKPHLSNLVRVGGRSVVHWIDFCSCLPAFLI